MGLFNEATLQDTTETQHFPDSLLGIKYIDKNKAANSYPLTRTTSLYLLRNIQIMQVSKNEFTVYQNLMHIIGYMVNKDILNLAFLGNDNPFNSQNMFLVLPEADFQKMLTAT